MNTWKCTLCSTTCIRPRHLQREHYQDCSTLVSFYYGLREVILDGRGYRSNLQIVSDRRGVGSSVWINALVDASWRWKAILLIAVMGNISSTQRPSIATFHRSIQLFLLVATAQIQLGLFSSPAAFPSNKCPAHRMSNG